MEQDELRENLTETNTWMRGLSMLLFIFIYAFLYSLAEIVLLAVIIAQFVIKLITGSVNQRLLDLGYGTSTYVYQIFLFLTFNSEERPFPFSPWPERRSQPPSATKESAEAQPEEDDDEPHLGV
jgi:hypothetical protein